jgi:guanylate kinase
LTQQGKLIVMAGPSAVGKGTLAKFIVDNFSGFHLSVSATTRDPRPGELEGVSYYFLTEAKFQDKVNSDEMLEWATVHGKHSYGTPRAAVHQALGQGLNVLLEIDVQGAFQVREAFADAILVFVKPPSFEELRNRLDKRGSESEQDKLTRLETAKIELARADLFDYVVTNDEVARCAQEVVELIQSTK